MIKNCVNKDINEAIKIYTHKSGLNKIAARWLTKAMAQFYFFY